MYQPALDPSVASSGLFIPPTLVWDVQGTSRLVMEEIFGPVLTVQSFRSPSEAVTLANTTRYGLAGSVHTEVIGLALETAVKLKAGVVWVNCHNAFDAASGFGGYKESGFGREGGKEGLYSYVRPSWQERPRPTVSAALKAATATWGKVAEAALPAALPAAATGGSGHGGALVPPVDRTAKLYVGGKQARPDGSYCIPITTPQGAFIDVVGDGNRKDVRNAVEAATKAAPGWGKRAAHNRAQIAFYIAENLSIRAAEFAARISAMTGKSEADAAKEVRVGSLEGGGTRHAARLGHARTPARARTRSHACPVRACLHRWRPRSRASSLGPRGRTSTAARCRRRRSTA